MKFDDDSVWQVHATSSFKAPCVYFKLNNKLIHTYVITGSAMCTGMEGQPALRLMHSASKNVVYCKPS